MKLGFHGKGFFGADEKEEIDNKEEYWEVPPEEDVHFPLQCYPVSSDCSKMVPVNYQQLQ